MIDIATVDGIAADDALRLAAALERDSEHPIARALVATAAERGLQVPRSSDLREPPRARRARLGGRA